MNYNTAPNHPQQPERRTIIMQYRVVWEIDLDAESVEDAARQALEIQRDPASIATCFIVTDEIGTRQEIDLGDKDA